MPYQVCRGWLEHSSVHSVDLDSQPPPSGTSALPAPSARAYTSGQPDVLLSQQKAKGKVYPVLDFRVWRKARHQHVSGHVAPVGCAVLRTVYYSHQSISNIAFGGVTITTQFPTALWTEGRSHPTLHWLSSTFKDEVDQAL